MVALVRRYARTHGPVPDRRSSPAATGSIRSAALRELERAGELVRGELLPGGTEREWCDPDVLRRLRRASLAHLRAEAEAVDTRELARFLPELAERRRPPARRAPAPTACARRSSRSRASRLTPEVWERDVLPRRLGAYSPAWLDELCTGGELVWIGAGALGRSGGKVALYFREDVRLAGPPPANAKLEPPEGEAHDAIRELLGQAALLLARPGRRPRPARARSSTPRSGTWPGRARRPTTRSRPFERPRLRSVPRAERRGRRFAARRAAAGPGRPGALVADRAAVRGRPAGRPPPARAGRADARALRDRHPRDRARRGRSPAGSPASTARCRTWRCSARRGAATSSRASGGAQFALPGAVERLRSLPAPAGGYLVLAATDPANPYGAGVPVAEARRGGQGGRRPSRTPGRLRAAPRRRAAAVRRAGRAGHPSPGASSTRRRWRRRSASWRAPPARGSLPRLAIERLDGEPVIGSGLRGDPDRGRLLPPAAAPGRLGVATGAASDGRAG